MTIKWMSCSCPVSLVEKYCVCKMYLDQHRHVFIAESLPRSVNYTFSASNDLH